MVSKPKILDKQFCKIHKCSESINKNNFIVKKVKDFNLISIQIN